jgi:thioredoxin 1
MKKRILSALLLLALLLASAGCSQGGDKDSAGEVVPGLPIKNTVTLVDLGADTCVPCRLMAPILEELKEEYKGRAAVIFIDVWDEANKDKARAFKVLAIPTQIFFDKKGKEVFRHTGFLDKETMVAKLEELLAR